MLPVILIIIGAVLLCIGVFMLWAWLDGRSMWFDAGIYDRSGSSKTDRQFLNLYYIAVVLAPLLCGAVLIVYGLRKWL